MNYIPNLGGPFYLYVSKGNSVVTDYFIHTVSSQSSVYFENILSFAPSFALGCMLLLVSCVCSGSGCNTIFLQILPCPKICSFCLPQVLLPGYLLFSMEQGGFFIFAYLGRTANSEVKEIYNSLYPYIVSLKTRLLKMFVLSLYGNSLIILNSQNRERITL